MGVQEVRQDSCNLFSILTRVHMSNEIWQYGQEVAHGRMEQIRIKLDELIEKSVSVE